MSKQDNPKYTVYVDDNYHYMDEDERYKAGEFDDCETAKQYCMARVDEFLFGGYKPDMTWETLLEGYQCFGEDPWIATMDTDCQFSAWTYAEKRAKEICKTP